MSSSNVVKASLRRLLRFRITPRFSILAVAVVSIAALAGCSKSDEEAADDSTPTVVSVQTGVLKLATLHRYVQGYGTVEPAPGNA